MLDQCVRWMNFPRRGGPLRPPASVHVVLMNIACAVDASRSCRSRRYSLTPLMLVATLSSPGPPAQHSTALRAPRPVWQITGIPEHQFSVRRPLRVPNPEHTIPCRGGPLCPPAVTVVSLGSRVNRVIVRVDVLQVADSVSTHTTNSLQNPTYTSSNTTNPIW